MTVKVNIVGRDFSPIYGGSVSITSEDESIVFCDGFYKNKINKADFITRFAEKHEAKNLLFVLNRKRFGNQVGVIRDKKFMYEGTEFDVTLQINCRFDDNKRAYFLIAMLCSGKDDIDFEELADISNRNVFEILLLLRFRELLKEAAKKGIFRQYRRFEENDSRPRGVLDISRHIRLNGNMNNGRIAYSYRGLTANNSLNQLIIAAYRKLKRRFPAVVYSKIDSDTELHSMLSNIEQLTGFSNINTRKLISDNLKPVTHPFYHEYEGLRKLCLKILRDENISIFDAHSSDECESLLVDITKLWENYIEAMLEPLLKEFGIEMKPQENREYCKKILNKKSQPDFYFQRGNTPLAILDAKFKPHWNDAFKGIGSKFTENDINKCMRDMSVFSASHTGVIFPCMASGKGAGVKKEYKNGVYLSDDVKSEIINKLRPAGVPIYRFNMTRIIIPEFGDSEFSAWQNDMNENARKTLRSYLSHLTEDITENSAADINSSS